MGYTVTTQNVLFVNYVLHVNSKHKYSLTVKVPLC